MAYKDKAKQREANREIKRKQRQGVTSEGLTEEKEQKMLTRPNRLGSNGLPEMVANDYNPDEVLSDGRKRYLGPFSDGQALDRSTVNSYYPEDVGGNPGQHPFYSMPSVVGFPSKSVSRLNVTRDIKHAVK